MAKKTEIGRRGIRPLPKKTHHSAIRKKAKPGQPNWVPISPGGGGSHIWNSRPNQQPNMKDPMGTGNLFSWDWSTAGGWWTVENPMCTGWMPTKCSCDCNCNVPASSMLMQNGNYCKDTSPPSQQVGDYFTHHFYLHDIGIMSCWTNHDCISNCDTHCQMRCQQQVSAQCNDIPHGGW